MPAIGISADSGPPKDLVALCSEAIVTSLPDPDAFALETQAITLDGVSNDGIADEKDNYRTDIENVIGGLGDDHIVGSTGANRLEGRDGADILEGQGGADVLVGGQGADDLRGGGDFDRVEYPGTSAPDDDENQIITIDDAA